MELQQTTTFNIQVALFFSTPQNKLEKHTFSINETFENKFDMPPTVLPVPGDDQLQEVPVVTLRSSDGTTLTLARARVDLTVAGQGVQELKDVMPGVKREIEKLCEYLLRNSIGIKRIGFVVRHFVRTDKPATDIGSLLGKKITDFHNNDFVDAAIRLINRTKLFGFETNNWSSFEIFSANIAGQGDGLIGMLITRDFNTVPEQDYSDKINNESISSFLDAGEKKQELSKILTMLYGDKSKK